MNRSDNHAVETRPLPPYVGEFESDVASDVTSMYRERLEAGLDRDEVRDSLDRWTERLIARVRHAVADGARRGLRGDR